jgi:hypothetical protein
LTIWAYFWRNPSNLTLNCSIKRISILIFYSILIVWAIISWIQETNSIYSLSYIVFEQNLKGLIITNIKSSNFRYYFRVAFLNSNYSVSLNIHIGSLYDFNTHILAINNHSILNNNVWHIININTFWLRILNQARFYNLSFASIYKGYSRHFNFSTIFNFNSF